MVDKHDAFAPSTGYHRLWISSAETSPFEAASFIGIGAFSFYISVSFISPYLVCSGNHRTGKHVHDCASEN